MNSDELASPGYAVFGASTKITLATLDPGQLMVRHPQCAQPIVVPFPRPAELSGREGAERFPQSEEPSLKEAVLRQLRTLDLHLTLSSIDSVFEGHYSDDEILRARDRTMRERTMRERPADVTGHFQAHFRSLAAARRVTSVAPRALKRAPFGDPYGA